MSNVPVSRRAVLVSAPVGILSMSAIAQPSRPVEPAPSSDPGTASAFPKTFPAQDPELVRGIVGASHANLPRVQELLKQAPQLATAAWDWGFGDWETALGAASHTGRRDIAEVLMAHGARPDLFTHAMLGNLDVVKATVQAMPGIQRTLGPHGITLMRHAQAGREAAAPVVAYLTELGDADNGYRNDELTAKDRERYHGTYAFGPAETDAFEVLDDNQGRLSLRRVGDSSRRLFCQGDHAFIPAGAKDVTIQFEISGDVATGLRITTPAPLTSAVRK